MWGSPYLTGFFLILFHVSFAHAVSPADSTPTDSFTTYRDQIIRWAAGFVAKKRASVTGFAKPNTPFGGVYHYADERIIFGKTADREECALHLGRRIESGEWAFNFYLEQKKRPAESVSMLHENLGFGDDTVSFQGYLVVQSQPIVSNIETVTSQVLHTTASSISLLSIDVYKSGSPGEESLSILLDDDDNIIQVTYRFINESRIRDGSRVDPVTCYFNHVS